MKDKNNNVPATSKLNLLRQICNFIPDFLIPKLARETGVEDQVRTFSAWSHVVSLLYAQLTHSIGLNDVCDALSLHSGPLSSLRGATPPSRNNLSNCNKVRTAEMAEKLFWAVFDHLGNLSPRFVSGKAGKLPRGERYRQLRPESTHFIDTINIIAYRAESALSGELREHLAIDDDARALLRRLFLTRANLRPDYSQKTLTVELHRLGSPFRTPPSPACASN